jgi:hypothetical protein
MAPWLLTAWPSSIHVLGGRLPSSEFVAGLPAMHLRESKIAAARVLLVHLLIL